MAYNFGQNPSPQNNQTMPPYQQNQQMAVMPFQTQNVQPLFPQPQGNVYNINSTLEVANVPTGAGISVALCLNEGFMYIKTMQNGNPMFWAYRIIPYDGSTPEPVKKQEPQQKQVANQDEQILKHFENYDSRFNKLENQVTNIEGVLGKIQKEGEWKL